MSQFTDYVNNTQRQFIMNKIKWAAKFIAAAVKDESLFNYNFSSWQCGMGCPHVAKCEKELGMKLR